MKSQTIKQFRHCQATIANFGDFTIFYSYTCPKIVIFPDGGTYKFTFEDSRRAGTITSSKTTSTQCNQRLGFDHKTLKPYNLKAFENKYFDTRLDTYF